LVTFSRLLYSGGSNKEGLMSGIRMQSLRRFSAWAIAFVFSAAAFISPAMAADSGSSIPDLGGQWGRDMLFFEPPSSGPGRVVNAVRKADGTVVVQNPCCGIVNQGGWLGDHTSPILKPEAAAAVRKFGELASRGTVAQDLHNTCWPEPPPYVMSLHFGVQILQQRDEVTLLYLLYNTVRRVRLNALHPDNPTPSWQGHSVGRYEGDTLVIDTVGIKVAPFSTVDPFGTPHSTALHVVERYRLIDGEAAAEAQRKHGAVYRPSPPYGRGTIDPDTGKKGLQVEFTSRTRASSPRRGRDGSPIGASSATGRKRSAPRTRTFWARMRRFRRRRRRISEPVGGPA
jgi:hypothetical protein